MKTYSPEEYKLVLEMAAFLATVESRYTLSLAVDFANELIAKCGELTIAGFETFDELHEYRERYKEQYESEPKSKATASQY